MRLFKGPIALVGGILALRGAFAIDVDPENEGMSITRGRSQCSFRGQMLTSFETHRFSQKRGKDRRNVYGKFLQ